MIPYLVIKVLKHAYENNKEEDNTERKKKKKKTLHFKKTRKNVF